jgi:hypothetical protein
MISKDISQIHTANRTSTRANRDTAALGDHDITGYRHEIIGRYVAFTAGGSDRQSISATFSNHDEYVVDVHTSRPAEVTVLSVQHVHTDDLLVDTTVSDHPF